VTADHDGIPEAAHPVVEIEWPPGGPGGEPVRLRVGLKERCGGCLFHGPVRVPFGAGSGSARLTLSYPGLDSEVLPVTVEVPVREAGWRGWFMAYGPWGLGAVLGAGVVWFAVRKQTRLGRSRRCT